MAVVDTSVPGGRRAGLLDSYEYIRNVRCVLCGQAGVPVSLRVIEYSHATTAEAPDSFVQQWHSGGKVCGSVPVCIACAPPCRKCSLPITTRWTVRMFRALQGRYAGITFALATGLCRAHVHLLQDIASLCWRSQLPNATHSPAELRSSQDSLRAAR